MRKQVVFVALALTSLALCSPALAAGEGLEVLGMEISTSSTEVRITVASGNSILNVCYYGRLLLEVNGAAVSSAATDRERVQTPVLGTPKEVNMQTFVDPATEQVILRFSGKGWQRSILVTLAAGGELCQ